MKARWIVGAAFAAALSLAGCMHPTTLKPGITTIGEVVSNMGRPTLVVQTEEGSRLIYSWLMNREVWWVRFDKAGRFLGSEQALDDKHFAMVKIGESTKEDVLRLFGPPDQEMSFALKGTTAYNYPYMDMMDTMRMKFWVEFRPDGVVLETASVIDPPSRFGPFW